MKKILAVLLAVLMAFSALTVSVMAAEETTVAVEAEAEDNLVQPENFTQLLISVIFKAFEKVISTFISFFEDLIPGFDLDGALADGIGGLAGAV